MCSSAGTTACTQHESLLLRQKSSLCKKTRSDFTLEKGRYAFITMPIKDPLMIKKQTPCSLLGHPLNTTWAEVTTHAHAHPCIGEVWARLSPAVNKMGPAGSPTLLPQKTIKIIQKQNEQATYFHQQRILSCLDSASHKKREKSFICSAWSLPTQTPATKPVGWPCMRMRICTKSRGLQTSKKAISCVCKP